MRATKALSLTPALALLAVLSAAQLSATSVLAVDFDRLSKIARHVVSGEVVRISADADENGYIYSNVSIRVAQAVPQQLAGREYTLRMIGGELDGKRMFIQGMPSFGVGDEVVLFLNANESSVLGPTVGVWQGVFFVERDPATGARMVVDHQKRPVLGVQNQKLVTGLRRSVPEKSGLAAPTAGDGSAPSAMGVESFFNEIRQRRVSTGLNQQ